jgi:hypothetical protein
MGTMITQETRTANRDKYAVREVTAECGHATKCGSQHVRFIPGSAQLERVCCACWITSSEPGRKPGSGAGQVCVTL